MMDNAVEQELRKIENRFINYIDRISTAQIQSFLKMFRIIIFKIIKIQMFKMMTTMFLKYFGTNNNIFT